MGDARGHFDGDTLVVETTNFTNRTHFGYNNRYNSEKLKLVERFTPIAPGKLSWEVTVDDPDVWTRPWTFAMTLTKDDSAAHLRIRVSRRKLRPSRHPERRTIRRSNQVRCSVGSRNVLGAIR